MITHGKLNVQITHRSKNELGILADALRAMVSTVKSNIDGLCRREEDLMIALHQAEQAKSQFLANMSHEIRTPMKMRSLECIPCAENGLETETTGLCCQNSSLCFFSS